ncbi:MAG: Rab family GTPase [Promethearchaeota archaeon]
MNYTLERINTNNIVKIVVDGVGGVGKTTMLKKLESGKFDPETKLTIGVDFFTKEYYHFNGRKVVAQFWDLVGAQRFNFLRSLSYKGANCIILVYDLTRPNSIENIDFFVNMARKFNIYSDQIILVGTKSDLFYDRRLDPSFLNSFIEKDKFAEILETSARNNHNIDALFELATGLAMFNKRMINENDFKMLRKDLKERIKEPSIESHEKIIRKCWNCDRTIYFYEFHDTNSRLISEERLLELWENPIIQFYCCSCFKKFYTIKKHSKIL